MRLRAALTASLFVTAAGCGLPHRSAARISPLDAWRAYQQPVIADLESLAVRGSAAMRAQDYAAMGSVCRDGMAVVATARAGPAAPDAELERHYAQMAQFYEAGFATCAAGTTVSVAHSLPSLDRGNEELRATTARLLMLEPQ